MSHSFRFFPTDSLTTQAQIKNPNPNPNPDPNPNPTNTQYPIPNTQYPIPNTQYPIPNTQYPIPNTQHLRPNTQLIPNSFICRVQVQKKRAKSISESPVKPGILRKSERQESFANHTISSAIKADYLKPEVKFKLGELNSSVQKTKRVKQIPQLTFDHDQFSRNFRPFVVRKVEDTLILRKPELHDVLSDGLVVTNKNPVGQGKVVAAPRRDGSPGSVSSRSASRSVSRASMNRRRSDSRDSSEQRWVRVFGQMAWMGVEVMFVIVEQWRSYWEG
jgi:hypothetical protein